MDARLALFLFRAENEITPTIVFPDGSILVEPSEVNLKAKLGLS